MSPDPRKDITGLPPGIEHGDSKSAEDLLPLVYRELRRLAKQRLAWEKPGQTLQATALVHEAYLRLLRIRKDPGSDQVSGFYVCFDPIRVAQSRACPDDCESNTLGSRGQGPGVKLGFWFLIDLLALAAVRSVPCPDDCASNSRGRSTM